MLSICLRFLIIRQMLRRSPLPCRQLRGGSNWGAKRRWGEAGRAAELSFLCHVGANLYAHRAAEAAVACADAVGSTRALRGRHAVYVLGNRDGAAVGFAFSAADAGSKLAASSVDGTAGDGDVAATGIKSATDAGTILGASSLDVAALDDDVAAGNIKSSAYAGSIAGAGGGELAGA